MPVQLSGAVLKGAQVNAVSPAALFAAGEQGVWFDPSDMSTMFQDSVGTTPVSGYEQPVGLMLDKSKGLALGPELVTNGDFSNGTTGWTATDGTLSVVGGRGRITNSGNARSYFGAAISTTAGKWYKITANAYAGTGTVQIFAGYVIDQGQFWNPNIPGPWPSVDTVFNGYFIALSNITYITALNRTPTSGSYVEFDNISVREITGNHAFQSTSASRPVLSARYNLLTWTEGFSTSDWSKLNVGTGNVTSDFAIAPDGTLTADKLHTNTTNGAHGVYRSGTLLSFISGRASICAKAAELSWIVITDTQGNGNYFNVSTGAIGSAMGSGTNATITNLGNGWYRCSVQTPSIFNGSYGVYVANGDNGVSYAGNNNTDGVLIWGADLRVANDGIGIPAYQRVNTATDYDTAGFPPYLRFDGVDDSLSTASINFTSTDKMSMFAGARKLSDTNPNVILETSDYETGTGRFSLGSQVLLPAQDIAYISKGTNGFTGAGANGFDAPLTMVVSGFSDIAGDRCLLRVNSAQVASNTADQGAGNYSNMSLNISGRNSQYWFNGRIYSLIVRGATTTDAQINAIETWTNLKTRAY